MDPDLPQGDLVSAEGEPGPEGSNETGSDAVISPPTGWLLDGYVPI